MLRLTFILAAIIAAIGGWRAWLRSAEAMDGYCGQYAETMRDERTKPGEVGYTFLE